MRINLTAPANPLGYGVVGTNVLKHFVAAGHDLTFFPIGPTTLPPQDVALFQECIDKQSLFDHTAPSIRIWHQHDLAQHIGNGIRCGFPIFELDRLTEREVHHVCSQDLVFVCSHWAQSVINQYNKDSLVVPLGVDRSVFYPKDSEPWSPTRFINIGKWELRKGHDVLVEAFNRAFDPSDNVELWMMNHNPFLSEQEEQEWMGLYKNSKMGNRIFFIERVESHEQVADVINKVDCGVFPSRAEGWNLEALEMMACGKEVIVTDFSAHTEFCNIKNSKLIHITEEEEAFDGIWFVGQGKWAKLGEEQIDECLEHMRSVHKQKQGGKTLNKNGIETAKMFSWENTIDKMVKHIK